MGIGGLGGTRTLEAAFDLTPTTGTYFFFVNLIGRQSAASAKES